MKTMRLSCLLAAVAMVAACLPVMAEDTVTFGVVAPLTGNNIMVGDFVRNGALLAQKHINERGGILGKKLELVFEDEVDTLQTSVNAMTKILNYPEVVAFFGSTYSSNCIAISPVVAEKKIPMLAGGSSANIPKERNDFIWQARMTDDNSGILLAKAAVESIGMKKPAIIFISESFGTGLKDQTVAALANLGITVDENDIYAHNPDEKQFGPIISQIMHSDADGIIGITHQMPAAVLCMQVEAAGVDLPLLGSSSFASVVCRETAGEAADDWYGVADWTPEVDTDSGKAFAQAYRTEYAGKPDSDMPAVTAYDSVMLFAEACRIAGTTEDPVAINEGFKQIKAYPGAMSTYTPNDDHCFATSQFLTVNEDGLATLKEIVYVRQP
ncbi:MAG: ABC transporter substrate-binding protein [Planctomycetes bacterium]|nr:ABC transporter substrate-binding protein [Planctomycetota bacterium]